MIVYICEINRDIQRNATVLMKNFNKEPAVFNTNIFSTFLSIHKLVTLIQLSKLLPLFFHKVVFFVFFLFLFKHIFLAGHHFNIIWYLHYRSRLVLKEDVSVCMDRLKSAAFRRLRKFHIFFQCHQTTEFLKNCFNCVFSLPFCKDRYTAIVHLVCKFYLLS